MSIPQSLAWLFPEHRASALDPERDHRVILSRVLEQGRLEDVRWCVLHYGLDQIHAFLRDEGHPELSPRTLALWRAALKAKDEVWTTPRRSRLRNVAPWPD